VSGLVVSVLYLLNQGDILATAVPGFPVWDLAGLLGSTGWGLWVAALGVTVLRHPIRDPSVAVTDAAVTHAAVTHAAGTVPERMPASNRPVAAGPRR
jgi:hypothetical protein